MHINELLARLERTQSRGDGQFYASCPTPEHQHGDRSRGLSIKDAGDGRILLHCFAGCSPDAIVGALGLSLSDLFPENPHLGKQDHPRWPLRDLLNIIEHEAMVAHIGAEKMASGEGLNQADRDRLAFVARRIRRALELGGVRGNHA